MRRTVSGFRCVDCGQRFAGPHSFNRHKTLNPEFPCLRSSDALRSAGLSLNAGGFWTIHSPRRALVEPSEGTACSS
jgi:hypothetical protein